MTEREAMIRYLREYADLAPFERSCRRRERVLVPIVVGCALFNIFAGALGGWGWLDLANYGVACWFALSARWWVLMGIARRQNWSILSYFAAEAERRLSSE
jgi:hypothetical protein